MLVQERNFQTLVLALVSHLKVIMVISVDWNVQNPFQLNNPFCSQCGSDYIFGGINLLQGESLITVMVELSPHWQIRAQFDLWIIDVHDDEALIPFQLSFDDIIEQNDYPCLTNLCSNGFLDDAIIQYQSGQISHNSPTLQVMMSAMGTDFSFWGISNFYITYEKCPPGCIVCNSDNMEDCSKQFLSYQSMRALSFDTFNADGWIIENSALPVSDHCQQIPMFCAPAQCREGTKVKTTVHLFPHEKIKFQYRVVVLQEFKLYSSEIYMTVNGKYIASSVPKRNFYRYGICSSTIEYQTATVDTDWMRNSLIEVEIMFTNNFNEMNQVVSFGIRDFAIYTIQGAFCGDGIASGSEECDDGNIYPFDGCLNCQYSCQRECSHCVKGYCLECFQESNYNFMSQRCETSHLMQCPSSCEICSQGICTQCIYPYILFQQQCIIICGDNIVSEGYEQCDDGNDIPYDGCYNCRYQCTIDCQSCKNGQCEDQCQYGYTFQFDTCVPVCGDNQVIGDEQCDDGNSIQFDGCFNCQYSCPLFCDNCLEGECIICSKGYFFNEEKNVCDHGCGDAILQVGSEQCDDGNILSGDGCSGLCFIEHNWLCKDLECTCEQQPDLLLTWQSQVNDIQYVALEFSQPVKNLINSSFSEFIEISVLGIPADNYQITLVSLTGASYTLKNVSYVIEIKFTTTVSDIAYCQVQLVEQLYNFNNATLQILNKKVKLKNYLMLQESEIQASVALSSLQAKTLYARGAVNFLLMLASAQFSVIQSLQNIQEQTYLKYLNINYPQNIEIYFEYTNYISIYYFMTLIKFDVVYNVLDFRFLESQDKLQYYHVNSYFLFNCQTILFSCCMLFGMLIIIQFIFSITFILEKQQTITNSIYWSKLLIKSQFQILKIKNKLLSSGFKNIIIANFWDTCFITLAQLKVFNYTTPDLTISSTLSGIVLVSILIYISYSFSGTCSKKMRTKKRYFKIKRHLLQNIKKLFFIGVLIFFQKQPYFQIFLISLFISIYLIFIIVQKTPKQYIYRQKQEVMNQIAILFFTLSSFFYESHSAGIKVNKLNLGWIQITCLTCLTLLTFLSDFFYASKQLYNYINTFRKQTKLVSEKINDNCKLAIINNDPAILK